MADTPTAKPLKKAKRKKFPITKRNEAQREHDLAYTAERYLQGDTHLQIAQSLSASRDYSISRSQITKDMDEIIKRWQNAANEAINAVMAKQLAKIDALEAKYWAGYERSQSERVKTETSKAAADAGVRAKVTKESRDGDTKWLDGVANCIQMRCKILGIGVTTKHEHTGPGGEPLPPTPVAPVVPNVTVITRSADGERPQIIIGGRQ